MIGSVIIEIEVIYNNRFRRTVDTTDIINQGKDFPDNLPNIIGESYHKIADYSKELGEQ